MAAGLCLSHSYQLVDVCTRRPDGVGNRTDYSQLPGNKSSYRQPGKVAKNGIRISNKEQGISNHEVNGHFKFSFHFVIRYSLFLVRYSPPGVRKCTYTV